MISSNRGFKKKEAFLAIVLLLTAPFYAVQASPGPENVVENVSEETCEGAKAPPPPILDVNLMEIRTALAALRDTKGRSLWQNTAETDAALENVFSSTPRKTKLEQFFQLLFLINHQLEASLLPVIVQPPGITEVLLAAKVFTDPSFPKKITSVELKRDDPNRPPLIRVQFSENEVRFPINEGKGFATWDQGMCQIARELVFYPGFSFRLRTARNSKNLVVDDFDKVEIFGQFGTRKIFSIDLKYVDLEKVEFIRGTDQGKVKARVAQREFKESEHNRLFKFIGTMIPNTSKQRIDW